VGSLSSFSLSSSPLVYLGGSSNSGMILLLKTISVLNLNYILGLSTWLKIQRLSNRSRQEILDQLWEQSRTSILKMDRPHKTKIQFSRNVLITWIIVQVVSMMSQIRAANTDSAVEFASCLFVLLWAVFLISYFSLPSSTFIVQINLICTSGSFGVQL
jgi:hypothetical protein